MFKYSTKFLQCICFKKHVRTLSFGLTTKPKSDSSKMRAWQIHSYGDLNELQLTSARVPHILDPDELLIQVSAASLNLIDKKMISGYGRNVCSFLRGYELEFPLTLGRDFAGVVLNKGHGVGDAFQIGDKVYGVLPIHKQGSQAEVVINDKSLTLLQPSHLSAVEAASLLYAAMTAWSALYLSGELLFRDPRQCKVLILGASGGVGTTAIQILKSQHSIVVATCSKGAASLVSALGADVVIEYSNPEYKMKVAEEGSFDIILDCSDSCYERIPETWDYRRYISLNSPLLLHTDNYGLLGGIIASINEFIATNAPRLLDGFTRRWTIFIPSVDGLNFIDQLIKNKQLKPAIHQVFKFEELPKAYEALDAGHLRGKIVIIVKGEDKIQLPSPLKNILL